MYASLSLFLLLLANFFLYVVIAILCLSNLSDPAFRRLLEFTQVYAFVR